jgi:hypothetical protein
MGNQEWTMKTHRQHWYTRHRMKTNKIRDIKLKTKKMRNTDPPKTGGELDIRGNLSS